jgi:hypothetical protein
VFSICYFYLLHPIQNVSFFERKNVNNSIAIQSVFKLKYLILVHFFILVIASIIINGIIY